MHHVTLTDNNVVANITFITLLTYSTILLCHFILGQSLNEIVHYLLNQNIQKK